MKKLLLIALIAFSCAAPVMAEEAVAPAETAAPAETVAPAVEESAPKESFIVYTEKGAMDNHYTPSGWMGDYGDISTDEGCAKDPHNGRTCIKVSYSAKKTQGAGWMGIFWQNPPNNWGDQMGGYDLTGCKKLTFWAKGENGGEVITEFGVGGINGMFSDTDSTTAGPFTLTKEWTKYEIDLKDMDLTYISGGFSISASSANNAEGFTIYLDDIAYEK